MITTIGRELYYHTWEKAGSTHYYEVDFLISNRNKISVFEVKSSGTGKHESIGAFAKSSRQISALCMYCLKKMSAQREHCKKSRYI
ncbi:hypothetical protein DWB79_02225 [Treponema medium]|uniref:DUF4143 domain-containing protein n=1 Tax=Treponema medium TaxID=58231 RepID=A0ABX7LX35_TREMD|nr:hypothetical protein [Treponema medium]QSH96598.1 hypothetical protein DWB79_02225 [Treponema medium]